jgi:hypothetical protein
MPISREKQREAPPTASLWAPSISNSASVGVRDSRPLGAGMDSSAFRLPVGQMAMMVPSCGPRQQVQRHLRRGLPERRDHCHPHTDPRPASERLRRTLRPHRPRRMSRLATDHRPPPPRDGATHLHDPLQPRAPSPRTRAAPARPDKRGPATERRRNQAPRPTRRTDPRVPPRRSMIRHFETPQVRSG